MAEYKLNLSGWRAVAALAVVAGIFALRLMTFNDQQNNAPLMRLIELELITDYFPADVERLRAAYATGSADELEHIVKSITRTEIDVLSVQTSYPLFDLSTSKEVVVKVRYALNDASGARESGEKYFLFEHNTLRDVWRYRRTTGVLRYYLNFL
jgi:hypothetical protein